MSIYLTDEKQIYSALSQDMKRIFLERTLKQAEKKLDENLKKNKK